jgi:hypothetical protein
MQHSIEAAHTAPSAADKAKHDAVIELEGERLIGAAGDTKHKGAFHDELHMIDPADRKEALAAAKAYEAKREKNDPSLPKVEFFESNGELGQVKVKDSARLGAVRVAYDADKEEGPEKSGAEKARDAAMEKGKQAGDAVKGLFGHLKPKS